MMLLKLNDDCLRLIGEHLPLDDQIRMAHVCQRLKQIIENIWYHDSRKVIITREQSIFFKEHENYFYEFMQCISNIVEELDVARISSSELDNLCSLEFPKVKKFTYNTNYCDKDNADQDTKKVLKLLPQIKSLTITSNTTGRYLWQFEELSELHLFACENLKSKYFKKIFTNLQCLKKLSLVYWGYNTSLDERLIAIADCKTLEELFIDDHHLIMIMGELLKLKNLHKIKTYTRDYDTYILNEMAKRPKIGGMMKTMIFNDVFWSKDEHCENVKKMINLKCLILCEDDIENEQLCEIGKCLGRTLEEFHFINVRRDIVTEEGFLYLLTHCLNLREFDVSNTKINMNFIGKVIDLIRDQLQYGKRKTPLLLRCHNTQITKENLNDLVLPELLKISLSKPKIDVLETRVFQCEWLVECNE